MPPKRKGRGGSISVQRHNNAGLLDVPAHLLAPYLLQGLDAQSMLAMFQTCKALRDLVMSTASVTLSIAFGHNGQCASPTAVATAAQALQLCPRLHIKLQHRSTTAASTGQQKVLPAAATAASISKALASPVGNGLTCLTLQVGD
jgi:hypothetical protein